MIKKGVKFFLKVIYIFIYPQKINWLSTHKPYSREFGLDRGTAIDRVFIDDFLNKNSSLICSNILEFGDDRYISKYAKSVNNSVIFGGSGLNNNSKSFNYDLTNIDEIQEFTDYFDCIIATNVLNFIYDFDTAIKNLSQLVKKENGFCLVTVAGLSSISSYDYERWGDFWRFNDLSMMRSFNKYFEDVEIDFYGNATLAAAFILGLSKEEVPINLFEHKDHNFQITIVIKASKPL